MVHVASVRDLQTLARERRKSLDLTQDELATRMGVSRKWVYTFETGSPHAVELSIVLRLLAALGLVLDATDPDATPRAPGADTVTSIDLTAHLDDIRRAAGGRERVALDPRHRRRKKPELRP